MVDGVTTRAAWNAAELGGGIVGCRKVCIPLELVAGCRGDIPVGVETLPAEV